jgi:hypothetical protein
MLARSLLQKTLGFASIVVLLGVWVAACGDGTVTPDVTMSSGSPAGGTGGSGAGSPGSTASGGTGGGGGASPCDSATSACPCELQGECVNGTLCVGGLCINPCDFSYQCGAGKVCANGQCVGQCDAVNPCAAGYKCTKGICIPDPANPECGPQKMCADGEICVSGLCTTPCSKNADCDAGEVCDWSTGSCIDNPSAQPVCEMNNECASASPQICGEDGFCHFVCDPMSADMGVAQCKSIDTRFVKCDKGVCKTEEEVNPECTTQKPCPEPGKDCISNKCL